jgi:hypothetical protein
VKRPVPFRVFEPEAYVPPASPRQLGARRRVPPGTRPRCKCGCGRAANWPKRGEGLGDEPLFHARLCGYKMACKMVTGEGWTEV